MSRKSELARSEFLKQSLAGGFLALTGGGLLTSFASDETLEVVNNYEDINWKKIRKQFVLNKEKYYFNMAGLGLTPKPVIDSITESMLIHEELGTHGRHAYTILHRKIARFLGTEPNEVAMVRNATEGMNIIAKSISFEPDDEVIITTHEHVGGAAPWLALQEQGVKVVLVDLDLSGVDNLARIEAKITDRTKAIAVSHVTCSTGMILPVKEIAKLCKERGIYSCIDGAQAIGMIPVDLGDIAPDFYTCSGHKWLLGPKGTGILYIKQKIMPKIQPVFAGAYANGNYDLNKLQMDFNQTAGRVEYGTRNTPIAVGLINAIQYVSTIGVENLARRGKELVDSVRRKIADTNIEILTPSDEKYACSIITVRFPEKDNLELANQINRDTKLRVRGIYENNLNAIRISMGITNSEEEIEYLTEVLKGV